MRKKIILSVQMVLCFVFTINAQRYQATTGTTNNEEKWAVVEDARVGGYVAIGNESSTGVSRLWISSYTPNGTLVTTASATNNRRLIARDISLAPVDPNNGNPTYYITGWTEIFYQGVLVNQMFTGRIDLNGVFLWYQENPFAGAGNDKEGIAIVTEPATQDAIAVGIVQWPGPGPVGPMVILTRFAPLGGILWSNVYTVPGLWMPREIDLGVPVPGVPPVGIPGNFIITGEMNMGPGVPPQTFAAVYDGLGAELWRNLYPAAPGFPTAGDAGYDVVWDPAPGTYCVVGAVQTAVVRAAITSTPYILRIAPGGALVGSSVYTTPAGAPMGLYPRCVSLGRNAGQVIFAGPNYTTNRTFSGMTGPVAPPPPGVFWDYAGLATANSFPQPFILNDAQPEDILQTNLGTIPGNLISTNAVPGAFGLGDAHFIRTNVAGQTPDSCKEQTIPRRTFPSLQITPQIHQVTPLLAWGNVATLNNPYPVNQVFCRDTCIVTASYTYTQSGQTVNFGGSGSGNGSIAYSWTFGDGGTSSVLSPAHTYTGPGPYVACLTVTNSTPGGDTCSATYCDTIKFCSVTASYSYTQSGQTANFTGTATGNGTLSYAWAFGDGGTSTLQNPSHTYAASGPYVSCLTVTNITSGGDTCTATYCDTIRFCTVTASYSYSKSGQTASFTGSGTGNGTLSYAWVFGDGGTSTLQNPSHTYAGAGPYVACVTVTNVLSPGDTCRASYCDTIRFCTVTGSYTYTQNKTTVNFSGTGSGNGTISYSWNFGDGGTSTLQNPSHTYATGGNYNACLTVTNILAPGDTCRTTICKNIAVCDTRAAFNYAINCKTVTFTNTSTSNPALTTCTWLFGDGTTSSAVSPVKTYTTCGVYNVRLIVCNSICCDTVYQTVNIPCCSVSADFCVSTTGRVATLNINTAVNLPVTTYTVYLNGALVTWNNGTTRTLTAGNNTLCVRAKRVTCGDTCCATSCKTISVSDTCTLAGDFWYQVQTTGAVVFTNKTTPTTAGNIYSWDFGVSGITTDTSSALNPTYTYTTPGTYTACLTVRRLNGADTCVQKICKQILVDIPCKVKAKFTSTYCVDSALKVSFTNASTGAVSYEWDFGVPGITTDTSTKKDPSYTFPAAGTYIVCLKAYSSANCWYRVCYKVVVSSVTSNASCSVLPSSPLYRLANPEPPKMETELVAEDASTGNDVTDNKQITVELPLAPGKLNLFPNPASQEVQIAFLSGSSERGELMIYNSAGKLVYKKAYPVMNGKNKLMIPVRNLPDGIYLVRLQYGQQVLPGHFFVNNH